MVLEVSISVLYDFEGSVLDGFIFFHLIFFSSKGTLSPNDHWTNIGMIAISRVQQGIVITSRTILLLHLPR